MAHAIRNPAQWAVETSLDVSRTVSGKISNIGIAHEARKEAQARFQVRTLTMDDLREALRRGVEDFKACRSDVAALCLVWPLVGFAMAWFALGADLLPLVFPMLAGFALVGPAAAVGVYEMSRRREAGGEVNWLTAFGVLRAPSFAAILALGLMQGAVFVAWLVAAQTLHAVFMGPEAPATAMAFLTEIVSTGRGWAMAIIGCGVGFLFAATVLAVSVVSFPMLLDRSVGLPTAVATSIRVTMRNPRVIAAWGLIVAVSLAVGFATLMVGLIVVLPVLGHATWHLYRLSVEPEAVTVRRR